MACDVSTVEGGRDALAAGTLLLMLVRPPSHSTLLMQACKAYCTWNVSVSIKIDSGKPEDGTWTACFLHSVLKVCLSTVAGCLLASHWVVQLPVSRHMGMQ
jgi:hypothetical protein